MKTHPKRFAFINLGWRLLHWRPVPLWHTVWQQWLCFCTWKLYCFFILSFCWLSWSAMCREETTNLWIVFWTTTKRKTKWKKRGVLTSPSCPNRVGVIHKFQLSFGLILEQLRPCVLPSNPPRCCCCTNPQWPLLFNERVAHIHLVHLLPQTRLLVWHQDLPTCERGRVAPLLVALD